MAATKDACDVRGRHVRTCKHFIVRSAYVNPDTIMCSLSDNSQTYAPWLSNRKIRTMKASVEVSESEHALRMTMPAILEVGNLLVRRSTIRIHGMMKKALLQV